MNGRAGRSEAQPEHAHYAQRISCATLALEQVAEKVTVPMSIELWVPNDVAGMADDNTTNPDRKTEGSKEEKTPTPTLAAEIAKHVVAALRPQPEASTSKGKRICTAIPHPPHSSPVSPPLRV